MRDCLTNLHRLAKLVACRHDNQKIDITVGVRFPVRARPEKNNLFRLKALSDFVGELTNQPTWNVRAAIPSWQANRCASRMGGLHPPIVAVAEKKCE